MAKKSSTFRIAMVLYDGFDPMDIAGPHEVFSWLGNTWKAKQLQIDLIAESLQPPCTSTGLRLCPTTTFDAYDKDASPAEMIFVPGGTPDGFMNAMENERLINFVKHVAEKAEFICSVCFGAFILGQAGLLTDCGATTYWTAVDLLGLFPGVKPAPFYPRYLLHTRKRHGRPVQIMTGGGISSGIDEALKLVEMLAGTSVAEKVQLGIQYNPRPPCASGDPTVADPELWQRDLAGFKAKYQKRLQKIILGQKEA